MDRSVLYQGLNLILPVLDNSVFLTLLLLNTTCPVLANSVHPDQLASELIWICPVCH